MDLDSLFDDVILLDGGLSTALGAAGLDLSDRLWTARVLVDHPEAVAEAHLAFFRAGARVATTSSYQASFEGFAEAGIDASETEAILRRSVELAREARERAAAEGTAAGPLLVAASVGPYGAVLAGGQEYTGDYGSGMDRRSLVEFHRRRIEVLADTDPDLFGVETIPRIDEAEAILEVLAEAPDARAWVSFTCRGDGRTGAGDDLSEAVALVRGNPQVVATGVNCTWPEHVGPALSGLSGVETPLVVYPNNGSAWDPAARRFVSDSAKGLEPPAARSWIEAGARLVGGCCGFGPEAIKDLASLVREGL